MLYGIRSNRFVRYAVIGFVGVLIFLTPVQSGYAQEALRLPPPGSMLFPTWHFEPSQIIGLKIDRKNPFRFYFIIDKGQNKPNSRDKNNEYQRLIEYFLASLTIANEDMWVNLSPYRADKIVADNFAQTKMGSDLLAQDYILKQFTASLMSPEYPTGKELWRRIYSEAGDKYKNVNVPADIFSRVWITADTADVYQNADTAYLVKSHFKVMLDEDYQAAQKQNGNFDAQHARLAETIRRVVLPVIEQEVNEGKNFARLRQAYKAMILAAWFKKTLKDSLLGEIYVDKNKIAGIKNNDSQAKEKIYEQYLQAYKIGVVNYIKKEVNPLTHRVLRRKYFSGGLLPVRDIRVVASDGGLVAQKSGNADIVTVDLVDVNNPGSQVFDDRLSWRYLWIEASHMSTAEPFLSARIQNVILNHDNFPASLSYLLADKLATAHESRESVEALVDEAVAASPEIARFAQDDLSAILKHDPAVSEVVTPFLNFKGFQALEAYRVAHWFWQHDKVDVAKWFQSRISEAFGVDIHPAAKIGRGVVLDHGTGIVIGETAVVGDNVYFLHGVTLGSNGKDTGDRHPKVGNGVLLGAYSKVLGNIKVGDGAKVGANATVVKEVTPGATIVGPQAKELSPKLPAAAVKTAPRDVVEEIEEAITKLEAQGLQGGYEGVSTHSGVGGVDISLKYALTRNSALQNPEIVLVRPAYGGTEGIVGKYRDYGYKVRIVSDLSRLDGELNINTAAIIFESPANPSLPVIDIERVIKIAHAKAHNAITIFDGSFATPLGQQPLAWGVDVVVQVVTKGISGDGNVFGSVAVAKKEIAQKLRQLRTEPINEADAIKLKRGLTKFKERFARQQENARKYVDYLKR